MQPGRKPSNNAGQQGAYFNQVFKVAGKLSKAQAVAGYDYLNALVAVRRAQVDASAAVRGQYFAVLTAEKGIEISRALAELADEVYQIQLRQVAAGEAAGYEPLQLYAQSIQARNALTQAEANLKAAWRQLAAAAGTPGLPPGKLVGRADAPPPTFDPAGAKAAMLERHTDVLTARNRLDQAEANLLLQQILPVPDLQTNTAVQHDNSTGNNQFNVQLGFALPVFDRNQGNIVRAKGQIASAGEALRATQTDLTGRLAEALGRYEGNRKVAAETPRQGAAEPDAGLPDDHQALPGRAGQGGVQRHRHRPAELGPGAPGVPDGPRRAVAGRRGRGELGPVGRTLYARRRGKAVTPLLRSRERRGVSPPVVGAPAG